MKKPVRRIVVGNKSYKWTRSGKYEQQANSWLWNERVTFWEESNRSVRLTLLFRQEDTRLPGYEHWCIDGFSTGIISYAELRGEERMIHRVNFNRPVVIARLITYFVENGWNPETERTREVTTAVKLLDAMQLPEGS